MTKSQTFEDSWKCIVDQSAVEKHATVKVSAAETTILVQISRWVMQQIITSTVLKPLLAPTDNN